MLGFLVPLVPKHRLGMHTEKLQLRVTTPTIEHTQKSKHQSIKKPLLMGNSLYRITNPLFFTANINQWIPVLTRSATVNIIYESWRYLQQSTIFRLYGYVILENHIHFVAQSEQLTKHIQSFKSWTARLILEHLREQNAEFLLQQFAFYKKLIRLNLNTSFGRKVLIRS